MDDLIERLRAASAAMRSHYAVGAIELIPTWTMDEAADRIEALTAELDRRKYDGVHTCHDQCQREACVLRREVDALRAQRDAALARGVALGIEAAAVNATSFLVGDPANGVPLRNPMAHEIAEAIRALDPAAIIAADANLVCGTLGDSDGDDGA